MKHDVPSLEMLFSLANPTHENAYDDRQLHIPVYLIAISVDCCVRRVCWCFTSRGLSSVGQDEVVLLLEMEPNEDTVPRDVFVHMNTLWPSMVSQSRTFKFIF